MKHLIIICMAIGLLSACGEAQNRRPESADIKCYSGDTLIYQGRSKGMVQGNAPQHIFTDAATGKRTVITGNCVIDYN